MSQSSKTDANMENIRASGPGEGVSRGFHSLQSKYLLGMSLSGMLLLVFVVLIAVSWRNSGIGISPSFQILTVLSLLLLIVPGLMIHRKIVKRLRRFIETTRGITKGDLSLRIDTEAHDEITELALAFNEMTASLQNTLDQVRKTKGFYENILNSIDHGIVVLDKNFRVVAANKVYFGQGISPEEIAGKPCYEFSEFHGRSCMDTCPAHVTFSQGKSARDVHRHEQEGGEETVIELFSSPLRNSNGDVEMAILLSRDISRRAKMEKRLLRSDKMALVGQMASGLAHEIKNPIAGMSAALQVIYHGLAKNDPNREIFHEIQNQISRLERTLSDLLIYARPKRPKFVVDDINNIVRSSISLMEPNAKSNHVSVTLSASKVVPRVRIDLDQMQQVLLNLLINAIQAQPKGGRVHLDTTFDQERDLVRITIEDNGPGMTENVYKKIFDPFFTTKHTGTGLGLPICEQIMEDHQGLLEIDTRQGEGTVCRILLPAVL